LKGRREGWRRRSVYVGPPGEVSHGFDCWIVLTSGGSSLASYTIRQSLMNGPLTHKREQIKYIVIKGKNSNYIRRDERFDKGISHYFPAKYFDRAGEILKAF